MIAKESALDTKDIQDWGHRLRKLSPDQIGEAVQAALGKLVDCDLEATVTKVDYGEGVFGKAMFCLTVARKNEKPGS
mgnify:CR=1 FL=1